METERLIMSECNYCGLTDDDITPIQIKDYLGEELSTDKEERIEQTDNMFHQRDELIICKMCNSKELLKENEVNSE